MAFSYGTIVCLFFVYSTASFVVRTGPFRKFQVPVHGVFVMANLGNFRFRFLNFCEDAYLLFLLDCIMIAGIAPIGSQFFPVLVFVFVVKRAWTVVLHCRDQRLLG